MHQNEIQNPIEKGTPSGMQAEICDMLLILHLHQLHLPEESPDNLTTLTFLSGQKIPPKSSLFFSRKIDKVVGCATISGKAHLVGGFNKCLTTKERSNMPQKILENHPRGLFVTSSPPVHPELPSPILEPLVEFVSCEHPGHQPVAQNLRHSKYTNKFENLAVP